MKDQINTMFYKNLGTDEFKDEVIKKSSKAVKEVKIESHDIFESADFEKMKNARLNLVGAYQTAKHSSHHILSAAMLSGSFMVTGHSDSTFKIWLMCPGYFNTAFTAAGTKMVAGKDLTEENFNKKKKEAKSTPVPLTGPKAFELVAFRNLRCL